MPRGIYDRKAAAHKRRRATIKARAFGGEVAGIVSEKQKRESITSLMHQIDSLRAQIADQEATMAKIAASYRAQIDAVKAETVKLSEEKEDIRHRLAEVCREKADIQEARDRVLRDFDVTQAHLHAAEDRFNNFASALRTVIKEAISPDLC